MKMWDSEGLWLKAKFFVDKANLYDHAAREFPFYSALSVECLARSALTKVHPALNADPREDVNLLYAFGIEVTAQPRSLPAHSVFIRLEKIVPGFGKSQRELCDFMSILRNQHLHTAEMPYENLKTTKWLPRFYEVAKILNAFLGRTLEEYLTIEVANVAGKLITTLNEERRGAVKGKIAAHTKVFESKPPEIQRKLCSDSEVGIKLLSGGSKGETCPACSSKGILKGDLFRESDPVYIDGELLVDEQYLGTEFTCLGCGLNLRGVEELTYAEMEPQFRETRSTSLHELYEPEFEFEYNNM